MLISAFLVLAATRQRSLLVLLRKLKEPVLFTHRLVAPFVFDGIADRLPGKDPQDLGVFYHDLAVDDYIRNPCGWRDPLARLVGGVVGDSERITAVGQSLIVTALEVFLLAHGLAFLHRLQGKENRQSIARG